MKVRGLGSKPPKLSKDRHGNTLATFDDDEHATAYYAVQRVKNDIIAAICVVAAALGLYLPVL